MARVAVRWRIAPLKDLIVIFRMTAPHRRIIARAPDIPHDPKILLPQLIDQARKGLRCARPPYGVSA
jgi:hypothetical protein